jgi:SAM-dependent methyltransferase
MEEPVSNLDLDQARRRAKELLKAARAGDADAIARLPRRHDPIVLADAQLAIARELGFPSWPKLVASVGWTPATHDDVDWSRVQRVTIVPFLDDGSVVVPSNGLPADDVRPGEDVILDSALRIPIEQACFRRQGTHVFASTEGGAHVAIWVDGARHHTGPESFWWTGPASQVDDELVRLADAARLALTDEQYQTDSRRILDPSYLNADTPQGGSGFGASIEEWTDRRRMITEAIEVDGDFLDVGCANGFLLECVVDWCAARGIAVEPFGVDISPALVERARERLPQWADRIWVGDALTWTPPRTFDVVHALLDFVRPSRRRALVDNLLTWVAPGGRLVLSQYGTGIPARTVVEALGFTVAGETSTPTTRGFPSVWLLREP